MSFATDSEWERPYNDSVEREAQRLQAENAALAREAAAFRWLAAHSSVIWGNGSLWVFTETEPAGRRYDAPTLLDAVEKAMAAEAESEADQETYVQHYGLDALDEMAAESEGK